MTFLSGFLNIILDGVLAGLLLSIRDSIWLGWSPNTALGVQGNLLGFQVSTGADAPIFSFTMGDGLTG